MLQTPAAEREMLNHFRERACELPQLVLELYRMKAYQGSLSAGDAKYMLLMVRRSD